jgi:hypothetical protein
MRFGPRLFRASLWLATTSLSLPTAVPAWAQPAPPEDASQAAPPPQTNGDPPSVAGRLSAVSGTVSTHAASQTDWSPATLNTPVTTGDSFWTQPQSSATIEVGGDHFVLNETTELDVSQLGQGEFVGTAAQGEIFVDLPILTQGQSLTLNTPRGAVQIRATGQYDVVAGDSATPTTVTVISGSAQVSGAGVNLTVGANQAATITGTDQLSGTVGPAAPDPFLQAQLNVKALPALPDTCPQQVRYMTGGADLARYGRWQATSDYGQVWYPNDVPADWAPYRDGHWAYVGPWGWTWVDQAPWGFAPFHYGRWVSYGGRWGWVAAAPDAPPDAYPVYAPALVAFVGIGVGITAGLGFGGGYFGGGGGVGWVPLGFREPYRPWYHVSEGYLRNVNRVSVVDVRNITINNIRNVRVDNFANARAATVIPAGAMTRGEALRGVARPLPAAALARATPVVGRLPVTPTAQTPGLTRGEANRFHVALPARPAGAVAPGPAFRPGASLAHPALRPAGGAGGRPGFAGAPGPRFGMPPAGARPGLPPLRPADEARSRPPAVPSRGAPAVPSPGAQAPRRPAPGETARPAGLPPERPAGTPAARPGFAPRPATPASRPAAPEERHLTPPRAPEPRPAAPPRALEPRAPVHTAPPRPAAPRAPEAHAAPRPAPVFHPAPRPVAPPRPAPHPAPAARSAPRPAPPHSAPSHPAPPRRDDHRR